LHRHTACTTHDARALHTLAKPKYDWRLPLHGHTYDAASLTSQHHTSSFHAVSLSRSMTLTDITFYNNLCEDHRADKHVVQFPTELIRVSHGISLLASTSEIAKYEDDPIALCVESPEMDKLKQSSNATCHFFLCAWHQYGREQQEVVNAEEKYTDDASSQPSPMIDLTGDASQTSQTSQPSLAPQLSRKQRLVTAMSKRLSSTITSRSAMLVAYAALCCRQATIPYSVSVFKRASTAVLFDERLRDLLFALLDAKHASSVAITGTLVVDLARDVLIDHPEADAVLMHVVKKGQLWFQIRRKHEVPEQARQSKAWGGEPPVREEYGLVCHGMTHDWVPASSLKGEQNHRQVLSYCEALKYALGCTIMLPDEIAATRAQIDESITYWRELAEELQRELDNVKVRTMVAESFHTPRAAPLTVRGAPRSRW
jgi:hypothetical protein